jgi:hypothetical protein
MKALSDEPGFTGLQQKLMQNLKSKIKIITLFGKRSGPRVLPFL